MSVPSIHKRAKTEANSTKSPIGNLRFDHFYCIFEFLNLTSSIPLYSTCKLLHDVRFRASVINLKSHSDRSIAQKNVTNFFYHIEAIGRAYGFNGQQIKKNAVVKAESTEKKAVINFFLEMCDFANQGLLSYESIGAMAKFMIRIMPKNIEDDTLYNHNLSLVLFRTLGTPCFEQVGDLMLCAGAKLDFPIVDDDKAYPLLTQAVKVGDNEAVKYLLIRGASVNGEASANGFSPLHMAAKNGYMGICQLLLQYKANVNATSLIAPNMTPTSLAKAYGNTAIVKLLTEV